MIKTRQDIENTRRRLAELEKGNTPPPFPPKEDIIKGLLEFIQSLTGSEVVCIALLVGMLNVLDKISMKFLVFIKFNDFIWRTVTSFIILYIFEFLFSHLYKFFNKSEHDEVRNLKFLILTYAFYSLLNALYSYFSGNYVTLNLGVAYMAIYKIIALHNKRN